MGFKSTICPFCNKENQIPDDLEVARCMYCGKSIDKNEFNNSQDDDNKINNYLGLARTALSADNMEEAEKYYTKVLENDPKNSEAWYGKGKAAGWQSTLSNIRIQDSIAAFKNSVATAPDNVKNAQLETCITEINNIAVAIYNMADKTMREFVTAPDSYEAYIRQLIQLINALDEVALWTPNNRIILENIIHFCSVLIEGIEYRDPLEYNASKAWQLTPEYEKMMRDKLAETSDKIKKLDSSFEAPNPEVKQPKDCFVITATMGNQNHPYVLLLRRFRDEWIIQKNLGKHFITWYYKHGPKLAKLIEKNKILRNISYYFIVIPSTWIAKNILK